MSTLTQIRGNKQVKDLTITNSQIAESAGIETSKLEDGAEFLQRDGSVALTGTLNANQQLITGLPTPVSSSDAARKGYVDNNFVRNIDVRTLVTTNPPNGERMNFVLTAIPVADSEQVYLTGMIQEPGENSDYVISGNTITFHSPPDALDRIRVTYLYNNRFYDDIIINSAPGGIGTMIIGSTFTVTAG